MWAGQKRGATVTAITTIAAVAAVAAAGWFAVTRSSIHVREHTAIFGNCFLALAGEKRVLAGGVRQRVESEHASEHERGAERRMKPAII